MKSVFTVTDLSLYVAIMIREAEDNAVFSAEQRFDVAGPYSGNETPSMDNG